MFDRQAVDEPKKIQSVFDWNSLSIKNLFQRELSKSDYVERVNECKEGLDILRRKFNISSFRDINKLMLDFLNNKYCLNTNL